MDAALNWVLSRPWCILPADLETICAVASRTNESPEVVEARLGRPLENTRLVTHREAPDGARVAILPVHGPIARYANMFTEISGATSVQVLATDLQEALDNPSIRSIVLDINSPGGEATGIHDLAQYIRAGRDRKPIVAFVDGAGASGAYWIASAASRIVTSGTGMLGSIGVVMKSRPPDDRPNAPLETVSSGAPYKRIDNRTEAGKAHLQALVNDLEAVFVAEVAVGRGVAESKVRADFGKGGLLIGRKAVDAGMADAVGTLESVVAMLQDGRAPAPAPSPEESSPTRGSAMKFRDRVAAWFVAGQPEEFDGSEAHPAPPAPPPPVPPPAPTVETVPPPVDPRVGDLHRQVEELKKARRLDALARIRKDSVALMGSAPVASRITTGELPILVALHEALATVDFDHAAEGIKVSIPTDKPGESGFTTLAGALTESILARPPHRLYEELMPADAARLYPGGSLLSADSDGQDPTARYDEEQAEHAARLNNRAVPAKSA